MMTDAEIKTKLTKARTVMLVEQPFFACLMMKLGLTPDPSQPTLATDYQTIFYGPAYVAKQKAAVLRADLAHEAFHNALGHNIRRGARDHFIWNLACDYAINWMLKESGFELDETFLLDARFAGMSAEAIYDILVKEIPKGQKCKGGHGPGQPCGGMIEPKNLDQMSPSQLKSLEAEMKSTLSAALTVGRGNLPGSVQAAIREIIDPKLRWYDIVRRFFDQNCADDYDWSRPNRRYLGRGFCLPSLHSERLGEIVVVPDTSGSVNDAMLAEFMSELTALIETTPITTVHVVYCDAAVQDVQTFTRDDFPLRFSRKLGRGGTSFKPPFEWVRQNGIEPVALIYMTDLDGDFPEEPPYPTLWITHRKGRGAGEAPFGEVIPLVS